MVHSSLFVDNRHQTSDNIEDPPSFGGVNQEVTQIAIETQNLSREMAHAYLTGTAGKQGFFVISGRNSGEIERFLL